MTLLFTDRTEAGRLLAERLKTWRWTTPAVVLALPRGGVPVGAEIARALHLPLELLLVRKIGLPWQPEVAVAAVVDGEPPEVVIDEALQHETGVDPDYIESRMVKALCEIDRRRALYRQAGPPQAVQGRTVIVVDDGIATGTTMKAALKALRRHHPAWLVLAVPVASSRALDRLRQDADQIVCLHERARLDTIGRHYADFHPVHDDEVLAALDRCTEQPELSSP